MIVLHSSCVDGNCNHDDDDHCQQDKDDGHHHYDKDDDNRQHDNDGDRDEMPLLMETLCIETK